MKHNTFMKIAQVVAEESKCISLKVGCVLVKGDRIISTGYNGTPRGFTNCCDAHIDGEFIREGHHEWSNKHEVHSELNAILHSTESLQGTTAYVTHSPCFNCLKHLITAGVVAIYFGEKYYRMTEESMKECIDFCHKMDVSLLQQDTTGNYYLLTDLKESIYE